MIGSRRVEGFAAAVPDDGAGVGEQVLGHGDALVTFLRPRNGCIESIRQAVDLGNVEHRVGFQERDFPARFFARAIDFGFGEAAREHDHAAGFALSHRAAEFQVG